MSATYEIAVLQVAAVDAADFARFGTVLAPIEDGVPFGEHDARLDLARGVPRFYTMRLPARDRMVRTITRHLQVTQALAAANGLSWMIAVAAPRHLDRPDAEPTLDEIRAFRIPGNVAIALHRGTWHAGPIFDGPEGVFFNLELGDTNIVDHHTCVLTERYRTALRLIG